MQSSEMGIGIMPAFINNPTAWAVLLLVIVLLFGGKNIPEVMKGLGQGMRELKKGMASDEEPVPSEEDEWKARRRAEIEQEVQARLEVERRRRNEQADSQEGSP